VRILKRTAGQASELHELLSGATSTLITPNVIAAKSLRAALFGRHVQVDDCLAVLDDIVSASEQAVTIGVVDAGRPRGTQNHPGFDLFMHRLLLAAQQSGGKLAVYKSQHADGGWAGALIDAIDLLRPCLPDQFLPANNLGKRLDRAAKNFRPHTPKLTRRKS
jgi:hypothetical protein